MNWVRSRTRSCAWLALFALAMQMAVSFGHLHRDDLGLPPLARAAQFGVAAAAVHVAAGSDEQDRYPAADDYCPICATVALVAAAVPSAPPALVAPPPVSGVRLSPMAAQRPLSKTAHLFQARAPPVA